MKTHLWLFLISAIAAASSGPIHAAEPPLVVTSTTQVADFARQVVGPHWRVESILRPGQDPHLYRPTGNDARLVAAAELCLDNGWHLEGGQWMKKLAADAEKPNVSCVDGGSRKVTPYKLADTGNYQKDPHAWFKPANAAIYVQTIRDAIIAREKELVAAGKLSAAEHRTRTAEYHARAELYIEQLRALHNWILRQVNRIPKGQRILVTSHDAFNYFCDAYGFQAKTPIGWSTGNETGGGLTLARRQQVVKSIREYGVPAIFVETSVNGDVIREIAREADVKIGGKLYSDSMGAPGTLGETYLGMMRENVLTLVGALAPAGE